MPTIEIVRDEQAEIAESGFIIDAARHHVIRECPYADFLNRMARRTDLFVYHHLEHGTYVLCSWLIPGLSCVELTTFNIPPGHFDTDAPSWLVVQDIIRPAREKVERVRRKIQEAKAAKASLRLDSALERRSKAVSLRRRGDEASAALLESGGAFVGVKEGGVALQEAQERVAVAAKLADRSDGPWYDHLKPSKAAPTPKVPE
jgi:hypothetical protein